jgi:type II secretory pathway component GspD/PulD (secretin)
MRYLLPATLAFCLLTGPMHASAQTSPVEGESKAAAVAAGGIPIDRLIATVAKKTGKRFVVDPRVSAHVTLWGEDPSAITYAQFLTVLEVYGFIAVDDGDLVRVLPDANMKMEPIPTITSKDTRPASECVER